MLTKFLTKISVWFLHTPAETLAKTQLEQAKHDLLEALQFAEDYAYLVRKLEDRIKRLSAQAQAQPLPRLHSRESDMNRSISPRSL